jgi:hypothetical protein
MPPRTCWLKGYKGAYGMNRTFKAAVATLILGVSFAGSTAAGPLEDGVDAYYSMQGKWVVILAVAET